MSKKLTDKNVLSIYELVNNRDKSLYEMYKILDEKDIDFCSSQRGLEISNILHVFATKLGLEYTKETKLALLNRMILLREDDLIAISKTKKMSQTDTDAMLSKAYDFIEPFQMKIQGELNQNIQELNIPVFYKTLINGVFQVGKSMNQVHKDWNEYIINDINRELDNNGKSIEDNIKLLTDSDLLEKDTRINADADRAYSVLVRELDEKGEFKGYKKVAYLTKFKSLEQVILNLQTLTANLIKIENKQSSKEYKAWITYFRTLKEAFEETDTNKLINKWANVDIAWMKIDSPIQVGHPLEYYEDTYRNAVCIEFDLRIDDVIASKNNSTIKNIEPMFEREFNKLTNHTDSDNNIYELSLQNSKKVQLHIGKQMFYFGATLLGLSSAQVVPNDEIVSEQEGKKIFAFAEKSIELGKSKPHLKINKDIWGYEIMNKHYNNLYNHPDKFLRVYDITTIGHEYGHILWKNEESEITMNETGNYKNIEEFKASSGGLMAFFDTDNEKELWEEVFMDTYFRAVKLIAWKTQKEIEAYYAEGLITLQILFKTDVLEFNNETKEFIVNNSKEAYERFKEEYKTVYRELAKTYLNLKDANSFLEVYAQREKDGYLYPNSNINYGKTKSVNEFVKYFYDKVSKEGRIIDEEYKEEIKKIKSN